MSSLKKATRLLTKALEDPRYSYDQYVEILKRRHKIKQLRQQIINDRKAYQGFGYTYDPIEALQRTDEYASKIDLSDARSGTDDGVHSESEQPTESGES
jgi:hypothetical protein